MKQPAEFYAASADAQTQVFHLTSEKGKTVTLSGADRISGIRIGDTGILEHKLVDGYMRYTFMRTGSNPNVEPHCPRCHIPLRKGVALVHRGIGMTDDPIISPAPHITETSAAESKDCLKCPSCGYSELSDENHENK